MNKKIKVLLSAVIAVFGIGFFSNNSVYAADLQTVVNHAEMANLKYCYDKGRFKQKIYTAELNSIDSNDGHSGIILEDAAYPLPNGDSITCAGIISKYAPSFSATNEESKKTLLESLGYVWAKDSSKSRKCYKFVFGKPYSTGSGQEIQEESQSASLCADVDSSGKITGGGAVIEGNPVGDSFMIQVIGSSVSLVNYRSDGAQDRPNVANVGIGDDWNAAISAIDNAFGGSGKIYWVGDQQYMYKGSEVADSNTEGGETGAYVLSSNPFQKAQSALFKSNKSMIFTTDERQIVLQYYLSKDGDVSCTPRGTSDRKITINSVDYYVEQKPEAAGNKYNIPSGGGGGYTWWGEVDWEGLLNALNGATLVDGAGLPACENCTKDENGNCIDTPAVEKCEPGDEDCESAVNDEDSCFNGANSLGWIVCPIISALRSTLETIYDEIITPFLEINVSAFNMDGNGVYKGWQTFQGFANIAFVILLLVVIFSQVTGVGIDNLGIKRILPKLIVAAVLINLSYIICQLLVDVSNITGYGLRSLFESIQISGQSAGTGQGILTTAISGAIAAGAVAGAAATAGMWAPFIILPLLLGLITMLISVLFMFILLGVRQAGVIILVVVSPLAFVLYMLPNTKPLFTKWWKALTGLLLLFPICGAMIGGSALAGKILASTSTGFGTNLIAALLTVVPFFFVPTLLRGSFSALGNIGAKISGFGQRMAGGIGKVAGEGVKRTSAFKNVQANAKDREELRSRVAERRRLEGITSRIGNIQAGMRTPEQQLQYARAQAALEKMNDEDMFSDAELIQSEAGAKRFNRQVEAMKSKNVASGMVNRIGEVDGKTFTGSGGQFTQDTLAYSLYNATDDVERYAITSQLMASGHHGAEALHQVMQALGNDGNTAALATIAAAAKGDNKLGDLKSGARSTYDYINDLAEGKIKAGAVGSGGNVSDYVSGAGGARQVSFGGMSEQQLVNTDKEELRRYEQVIAQKRARGEELNDNEKKLVAQATAAWNNERIRGSAKKDIQDTISRIAFGTVRTPGKSDSGKAGEGESFDVRGGEDDDNGPAPTSPSGGSPAPSGGGGGGAPAPSGDSGSSSGPAEFNPNADSLVRDVNQARQEAMRENQRRDYEQEQKRTGGAVSGASWNSARAARREKDRAERRFNETVEKSNEFKGRQNPESGNNPSIYG